MQGSHANSTDSSSRTVETNSVAMPTKRHRAELAWNRDRNATCPKRRRIWQALATMRVQPHLNAANAARSSKCATTEEASAAFCRKSAVCRCWSHPKRRPPAQARSPPLLCGVLLSLLSTLFPSTALRCSTCPTTAPTTSTNTLRRPNHLQLTSIRTRDWVVGGKHCLATHKNLVFHPLLLFFRISRGPFDMRTITSALWSTHGALAVQRHIQPFGTINIEIH
mmetsp:Transcript_46321/g.94726  ORF Transcript_46321/g.94726 Transcript_46321/m.94726 type:complete len:223 (+) Transcript_46321:615-1283(+)